MSVKSYSKKQATDFSEALKRTRGKANMTQLEVFQRTGIHPTKLSRYENGKQLPSLKNLNKLIDLYMYFHGLTGPGANTLRQRHREQINSLNYYNQKEFKNTIFP